MKKITRLETMLLVLIAVIGLATFVVSRTLAEQTGGSPDSGEDSVLTEVYDELVDLGYGVETGSLGTIWNRIYSSATWIPESGITSDQVLDGIEYYEGGRNLLTGSMSLTPYEGQALQQRDDRDSTDWGDAGEWTQTNTSAEVWKDDITGLYWSPIQDSLQNDFDRSTCDFFTSDPRGSYDGSDDTCHQAINECANLELATHTGDAAKTTWYLPSQKELMQAYVHGIYKKTNTTWVGTTQHWSSTENQTLHSHAWFTILAHGLTSFTNKTTSYSVRCVLRDY